MKIKINKHLILSGTLLIYLLSTGLYARTQDTNCEVNYRDHIVHFADEDNKQTHKNHLITLNYDTMDLLSIQDIQGTLNHHADPLGTLTAANYMMLVPKGSNYITIRDIKSGNFVKKIRLPFRPRSGDAYNKTHNLVFLNSRDRPAGVLIDASSLKIVGKAGFNIKCNQNRAAILDPSNVYANQDNLDPSIRCKTADFGGDQISGHPIWISKKSFVILDRANRLLHVYKIKRNAEKWDTILVQTIKTNTSMHQLIPEDPSNPNNGVFYGVTESNSAQKKTNVSAIYKFKLVNQTKLDLVAYRALKINNIKGINGHNLYITPDKRFLYAPVGQRVVTTKESKKWVDGYGSWKSVPTTKWVWSRRQYRWVQVTQNVEKRQWTEGHWEVVGGTKKVIKGGIFVIDANTMTVVKEIKAGKGAGHVAFSKQKGIAIVTNHTDTYVTAIDYRQHKFIKNIALNFRNAGIFSLNVSHMQHISEDGEFYYNFWSDGGVFFRINLSDLEVDDSIEVDGVPIQGNFYKKIAINCNLPRPAIEDGYDEIFNPRGPKPRTQTSHSTHTSEDSDESSSTVDGYTK